MISNLGYSIAAAGFLLILLLLLTVPKRGAVRLYITLAVLMSLLWALQINSWIVPESTLYQYLTFDLLKLFSWILFLSAILHHQPSFIYHIRTYKIGYFISAFTLLILCLLGVFMKLVLGLINPLSQLTVHLYLKIYLKVNYLGMKEVHLQEQIKRH